MPKFKLFRVVALGLIPCLMAPAVNATPLHHSVVLSPEIINTQALTLYAEFTAVASIDRKRTSKTRRILLEALVVGWGLQFPVSAQSRQESGSPTVEVDDASYVVDLSNASLSKKAAKEATEALTRELKDRMTKIESAYKPFKTSLAKTVKANEDALKEIPGDRKLPLMIFLFDKLGIPLSEEMNQIKLLARQLYVAEALLRNQLDALAKATFTDTPDIFSEPFYQEGLKARRKAKDILPTGLILNDEVLGPKDEWMDDADFSSRQLYVIRTLGNGTLELTTVKQQFTGVIMRKRKITKGVEKETLFSSPIERQDFNRTAVESIATVQKSPLPEKKSDIGSPMIGRRDFIERRIEIIPKKASPSSYPMRDVSPSRRDARLGSA